MDAAKEGYYNRLKNQLFGCLCEREEGHSWEANLDAVLIELLSIPEKERTINYYRIYSKLAACRYLDYKYFRKTIFDVMGLLGSGL